MKIGMVVYSKTGNTKYVANKIKERLEENGDMVEYMAIEPINEEDLKAKSYNFKKIHDVSEYDLLVFGSFTEAFSLNRRMESYLKQMMPVSGIKACVLTTQGLPKRCMGGMQTQKKIKRLLEDKGVQVIGGENVNWKFKDEGRDLRIEQAVESLCQIIWKS